MTESEIRDLILEALYQDDAACDVVADSTSFNDVGMMTRNEGIVLRMQDGSEFQLTIVKSR